MVLVTFRSHCLLTSAIFLCFVYPFEEFFDALNLKFLDQCCQSELSNSKKEAITTFSDDIHLVTLFFYVSPENNKNIQDIWK